MWAPVSSARILGPPLFLSPILSLGRLFHSSSLIFGAVRRPLTSKNGNKNFYKGTRSGRMGHWSRKGHFIVQKWRMREYMVPSNDQIEKLTPFVSPLAPKPGQGNNTANIHSVVDYFEESNRPDHIDANLWERCRVRAEKVVSSSKKSI